MKALALVDAPDHVCCRYRIGAFAPALGAAAGSLTLASRCSGTRRPARPDSPARPGSTPSIVQRKLLPRWQLGCSASVPADSSSTSTTPSSTATPTTRAARTARGGAARFAAVVGLADAVIAGNDFLAGLRAPRRGTAPSGSA